mmetsp:Transcript_136023/g.302938  ORF Transcript_136023/g.302938 Transcript_136023/m.302938 type:complete len:468 (+) Transcript_136023:91-1494(+)
MPQQWKVIGGDKTGGILVRVGQELDSEKETSRLSTGAIVEELDLEGERLRYELISGEGPTEGWVSLNIGAKILLERHTPSKGGAAKPIVPASGLAAKPSDATSGGAAKPSGAASGGAAKPIGTASGGAAKPIGADGGGAPVGPSPANGGGHSSGNILGASKAGSASAGNALAVEDKQLKARVEVEARDKRKKGQFLEYCLRYKILGYPLPEVRFRVFCLHSEGGTESSYTLGSTPFLTWAKQAKCVEICAMDFPGRNKLLKSTRHTSADTLAVDFLAAAYDKVADGVPYVVWGHGVGAWVAFELMILARKVGLPLPKAAFLMAFPAPQLPETEHPWRKSKQLDDAQLREELLNWDRGHYAGSGREVLGLNWQSNWEPVIRADFRLFDEYVFQHAGASKFDFPIHAWHFDGEHYITSNMVKSWRTWTSGNFDYSEMEGMGHLTCFYEPELKQRYFQKVTELLKGYAAL